MVTSYSLDDEESEGVAWEGTGNPALRLAVWATPAICQEGPQAQALVHMPPNHRFLCFEYFFLWALCIWIR